MKWVARAEFMVGILPDSYDGGRVKEFRNA